MASAAKLSISIAKKAGCLNWPRSEKKFVFLCSLNLNCQATEQKACTFHKQNFFFRFFCFNSHFFSTLSFTARLDSNPPAATCPCNTPTPKWLETKEKFFSCGVLQSSRLLTKQTQIRTKIITSTFHPWTLGENTTSYFVTSLKNQHWRMSRVWQICLSFYPQTTLCENCWPKFLNF